MHEVSWKATYPIGNFRGAPGSLSLLPSFPLDFSFSVAEARGTSAVDNALARTTGLGNCPTRASPTSSGPLSSC